MEIRALALAFLAVALTAASGYAAESDEAYTLDCKRELVAGKRTKALTFPVVAEVVFSGTERTVRDPKDGEQVVFEDLTIRIGGEARKGGRFKGSTYDASTTYDGTFGKNLRGTMEWGYSRGMDAFTLTKDGRTLVCNNT